MSFLLRSLGARRLATSQTFHGARGSPSCLLVRLIKPSRPSLMRNLRTSTRTTSSTPKPPSPSSSGKKTLYPERLLIYHAGTGKIVLLGCLKVTTIFIFSFFALVVAPTHFYAEDQPRWVAFAVFLSGTVPLLFTLYTSSPFTCYIHLRLPAYTRSSRDLLLRYASSLPTTAEIDITTMNAIGKPRATRMKVGDLFAVKERAGLVNLRRETKEINQGRKWYLGKVQGAFGVSEGRNRGGALGGELWRMVREGIERRSRRK